MNTGCIALRPQATNEWSAGDPIMYIQSITRLKDHDVDHGDPEPVEPTPFCPPPGHQRSRSSSDLPESL